MYEKHIRQMSERIAEALRLDDHQSKIIQQVLERYWSERIGLTWTVDDVLDQEIDGIELLDRLQAREILQGVFACHDASVGINWDVLGEATAEYIAESIVSHESQNRPFQSIR